MGGYKAAYAIVYRDVCNVGGPECSGRHSRYQVYILFHGVVSAEQHQLLKRRAWKLFVNAVVDARDLCGGILTAIYHYRVLL